MIKLMSPLTAEQELLIERTIKHCSEVHKALGPGLLENIYSRAIALELTAAAIPFEREKSYPVIYRGEVLCQQRLDFVVADTFVLEIKSIEAIAPVHRAQLLSYLRISKLRVGLLMNFNVALLKDGLVRRVL